MTKLGNLPLSHRPVRRLVSLYVGLFLYGAATSVMIAANLGLDPWDVFHVGLARILGLHVGTVVILVGAAVLLCWIPIRQKPGLGTVSNVILIGLSISATSWLPRPHDLWLRWIYGVVSILMVGVASGLYLGSRMGPGPRDGIMTGLVARWHGKWYGSIRLVRTLIELTVLVAGFFMGGTVGWMTLVYAVTIGPVMHVTIPMFATGDPIEPPVPASESVLAEVSQSVAARVHRERTVSCAARVRRTLPR